jgi:hypothetical protein
MSYSPKTQWKSLYGSYRYHCSHLHQDVAAITAIMDAVNTDMPVYAGFALRHGAKLTNCFIFNSNKSMQALIDKRCELPLFDE